MQIVIKMVNEVWMFKGEADSDRDYQTIKHHSIGELVELILVRYPNSSIQILGQEAI